MFDKSSSLVAGSEIKYIQVHINPILSSLCPFLRCLCRRNMVLNISISSIETRRLGIDAHICELQLTLRIFAERMVVTPTSFHLHGFGSDSDALLQD